MKTMLLRFALVAAALPVLSCSEARLPAEPPRPVLTRVLQPEPASEPVVYAGEIRPRHEFPLGFRIPGKIAARLVDAGARIKRGDVLVRLDPSDTALATAAAVAQKELAEGEFNRYKELRNKNFISQSALEAKETAFKTARAQADIARNQSSYALLRADQDGVVSAVMAEAGQVVAAGQPVLTVAGTDALEVAVSIPETRIAEARHLKKASITLWSNAQSVYEGVLRELSQVADPVTRTYAARVAITNPDARMVIGMTASVNFMPEKAGSEKASGQVQAPLGALFQHEGKPALWIVNTDQTVALRPVTVARYGEASVTLEAGIRPGERIVIAGVHKLSVGEKINAIDAPEKGRDEK